MERNSRPYLSNTSDTVDRFLRNKQISSLHQPGTSSLITRFPTDGINNRSSTNAQSYTYNSNTPITPLPSAYYSTFGRRTYGIRPPLYGSARKTSNTSSALADYADRNEIKEPEKYNNNYSTQQEHRAIPIQIKDEAKKSKSALKSLRSFFKRHLAGKRDYSAAPVSKRYSSTLNINGSLPPYVTPIAHRRSTSTSSASGFGRPQSYSLSRATGRTTGNALNNYKHDSGDMPYSTSSNSLAQMEDEYQKRLNRSAASKYNAADQQRTCDIISTKGKESNDLLPTPSEQLKIQNNVRQLQQPRSSTTETIIPINTNTNAAREIGRILQKTAEIPCLKGLANHGNTCYFSAIIQCLSCCDSFAEYFLCKGPRELDKNEQNLCQSLATTLRCLWFNNASADSSCLKTLQFIAKANQQFLISHQQDAHECLIWLLDKLHEEIKEDEYKSGHTKGIPTLRSHKSEGELAIDTLERISGGKRSPVMDLFRAQFRSAMECTNPVCGFSNLTFDPYLSVSLSVPLPQRHKHISIIFIPFFGARQLVRYYFNVTNSHSTVYQVKERIMRKVNGLPEDTIACHLLPNGQSQFLDDDSPIDERLKEITLVEMPKLNEQQQLQDLVIAIVVFVVGIVPDGERHGHPFVVVLDRHWSYDKISNFLLSKCPFLLPRAFYPLPSNYTLLIQHTPETVACLDPQMSKPLFHESINKTINDKDPRKKVLKLIVEWSSSVRHEFSRGPTESVVNDFSFLHDGTETGKTNDFGGYEQIPIPLVNLLEDYIKRETIQDWKCPKCGKSPGHKELKFHSLPNILVFHLKRFEFLNDGITKKIDSRVQIPLDGLDMSHYVFNPDLRASTLPKHRKERSIMDHFQEASMLYDLVGVVYHYGERTNSGHYTATTRNPQDGQWRIFDDSRVSQPIEAGGEIRISSKSYLLFYQHRTPGKLTAANWFPQNVPDDVIAKYKKKQQFSSSEDDIDVGRGVLMRGSSKFYTGSAQPAERERAATALPERRVPISTIDDVPRSSSNLSSPYYNSLSRSTTRSASINPNPYPTYLPNSQTYPYASSNRIDQSRYSSYKF